MNEMELVGEGEGLDVGKLMNPRQPEPVFMWPAMECKVPESAAAAPSFSGCSLDICEIFKQTIFTFAHTNLCERSSTNLHPSPPIVMPGQPSPTQTSRPDPLMEYLEFVNSQSITPPNKKKFSTSMQYLIKNVAYENFQNDGDSLQTLINRFPDDEKIDGAIAYSTLISLVSIVRKGKISSNKSFYHGYLRDITIGIAKLVEDNSIARFESYAQKLKNDNDNYRRVFPHQTLILVVKTFIDQVSPPV